MKSKKLHHYLLLAIGLLLVSTPAKTHPSWGIVTNSKGEIFFSDVMHGEEGTIWKIDKKGHLSAFMEKYHAHSLTIDQNDVLWASANRYITGLIEGDGEHVLTKIYPNGKQEELIRTRTIKDYSGGVTTITANGEPVFQHQNKVFKITGNGKVELLVDHVFDRIVTLYTAKDGSIYVTANRHKNGSIYRIFPDGNLELLASGLVEQEPENPPYKEPSHNLLYGMMEDSKGTLYIANSGSRRIMRIDQDRQAQPFYYSEAPWFPTGITFYNQTAYIMEVGYESGKGHLGPRIVKVEPGKQPTVIADTDHPNKKVIKGSLEPTDQAPFKWNHSMFILLVAFLIGVALLGRNHLFLLIPFITLVSCSSTNMQAQEIPNITQDEERLLQEFAHFEAPHFLQLTKPDEPGEKLTLIAQLVDRETGRPIPNCRAFLYHTTTEGEYEQTDPDDPTTSRINGEITTNENGRFYISTILPADYPGKKNNRHIHATFYYESEFNLNFFFAPFVTNGIRKWSRESGHGIIMQLKKQKDGYFAYAKVDIPFTP